MKRIISTVLCLLVVAVSLFGVFPVFAATGADEIASLIDTTVSYKLKATGSPSVQAFIDTTLTAGAGVSSEWYVLALRQYEKGYSFKKYAAALEKYCSANPEDTPSRKELNGLMLLATGSRSQGIVSALEDNAEQYGIMGYVFGLHLVNNGVKSERISIKRLLDEVLSLRKSDGGWSVMGDSSDVDTTAMVIQALATHYGSDKSVKAAVDRALSVLSDRQQKSGAYISYGVENPESCAQVITALTSLGINPLRDKRFIKSGKTVLDGMLGFRLADGSFAHFAGGDFNENATVQALYSLISLYRLFKSLGPLYVFTGTASPELITKTETKPTVTESIAPGTAMQTHENNPIGEILQAVGGLFDVDEPTTEEALTEVFSSSTSQPQTKQTEAATAETVPTETEATQAESITTTLAEPDESREAQSDLKESTISTEVSDTSVAIEATASQPQSETAATSQTEPSTSVNTTAAPLETTSATQAVSEAEEKAQRDGALGVGNLKAWLCVVVTALALSVCLSLYSRGKRSRGNYIFVAIISLLAISVILFSDIQSPGSFYSKPEAVAGSSIEVTISIRCDTIKDKAKNGLVPTDGVLLPETRVTVKTGSTVFDVLTAVAREKKLLVDNKVQTGTSYGTAYIQGICSIYEFDYGEMSGWMYKVNGELPSVGCGEYTVNQGDRISWLYTTNLGEDLE